jgi:hypothetical protein
MLLSADSVMARMGSIEHEHEDEDEHEHEGRGQA